MLVRGGPWSDMCPSQMVLAASGVLRLEWRAEEAMENVHTEKVDTAGVSSVDGPRQRGELFGSKLSGLEVLAVNCFHLPSMMRHNT